MVKKAELKTKPTARSVDAFLDAIDDEERRKDCRAVMMMMKRATKAEPKMWGSSIVGFGDRHYKYASGREGDWFRMGFASRKSDLTLYGLLGGARSGALRERLGKHKTGKGCLYVKRLADVNAKVLEELVREAAANEPA